jgi:URI fold toxin 2
MHGNSKANPNFHHLYDIFKHIDRDTFKYGISDDPIEEEDGLSTRARAQLEEMNAAAEYNKFGAEILIKDIPGRTTALRIERAYIDAYYEKHGRNPIGNKYPKRK